MDRMDNIKISIVLPTYNGERFLADAINSVLCQTEKCWELIIVNDCSTDSTLAIAERYAKADSRIRVFSNAENKKLPASLNVGFREAKGQYLTWTSDDNLYKPHALATMLDYLEAHPETDMVSMNQDIIDEGGKILFDYDKTFKYQRSQAHLLHGCNVGAAFMYRRSVLETVGEYDENVFCAEDYDYWCRIALAGKIDYTEDNVYQYRKNSQSLTALKKSQIEEKTNLIKLKYANLFFDRFKYTQRDKALFWFNMPHYERPEQYKGYYALFKAYKCLMNVALSVLFWHSKWRRSLRRCWSLNYNYSFSQKRGRL